MILNIFPLLPLLLIADKPKDIDKLWFIGDDWMAETYKTYFLKKTGPFYLKNNFEDSGFSNNRFNSVNQNVVSRILNTFITAVNDNNDVLPKFVVFILDCEIVNIIDYDNYGVSTMFGTLLEWLIKNVKDILEKAKAQLPDKAKKVNFPQVYWIGPFHHRSFANNHL